MVDAYPSNGSVKALSRAIFMHHCLKKKDSSSEQYANNESSLQDSKAEDGRLKLCQPLATVRYQSAMIKVEGSRHTKQR